jgi:hypothetical protein
MATLSTYNLTLADWAKRLGPDGKVETQLAELLSQSNEILDDAVFKEGNLPTGHRVVIRTGLPTVYWRALNQGVPPSKSTTAQVDESCGMLEAYSEVDCALANLNGDVGATRVTEDMAFIESMNQTQATTLFYGNPKDDPKKYLGLAPRYSSYSGADNGQNVVLGGGGDATHNTSIYLVIWDEQKVFCTFPKGSKAGLVHQDLGEVTQQLSDGSRYQAYRAHYKWDNGLVVKDWRYVVRIANIDTTALIAQSGTQATTAATSIIRLMSRALDRIPKWGTGKPAFYMNRTVFSGLRLAAMDKAAYVLAVQQGLNQFGSPQSWLTFEGIPIRRVDAIVNTEAVVS